MYRIRIHGRGGQGVKTAGRILGTAFFLQGREVQDAPLYGAERRGAPMFAYVRAARGVIHERGIIRQADLVVVADDSLLAVAGAGVLVGLDDRTVLLLRSHETAAVWTDRLALAGPVLTLPTGDDENEAAALPYVGAACVGAAARLIGEIPWNTLADALTRELTELGRDAIARNLETARQTFEAMQEHAAIVSEREEGANAKEDRPDWVDLPLDPPRVSAPAIYAVANSVQVRTGLWRTMRPVVHHEHCRRCWWLCSTLCPDGAIDVRDGFPQIDYDHCKGCLICAAVCPHHAIEAIPEHLAESPGPTEVAP